MPGNNVAARWGESKVEGRPPQRASQCSESIQDLSARHCEVNKLPRPQRSGMVEDWPALVIPAAVVAVAAVLAFRVPLGGCGAASALEEFGGASPRRVTTKDR